MLGQIWKMSQILQILSDQIFCVPQNLSRFTLFFRNFLLNLRTFPARFRFLLNSTFLYISFTIYLTGCGRMWQPTGQNIQLFSCHRYDLLFIFFGLQK